MRRIALVLAVVLGTAAFGAAAQEYPSKPIRLINPLGVGGTAEALSRALAKGLSDHLGQPVVVETKSGATGTIGAAYVAKSPPDGYTLLYGVTGTNAIAPNVYKNLPYDPVADLAPVSIAFSGTNVLIAHSSLGVNSLQELVALAKSKPGTLAFASAGSGSMSHLNAERLKAATGIDLVHVPYKGGGAAAPDLMSGRVQVMVETGPSAVPLVKSGKLKAIAVTTPKRSPLLPEVPTYAELGLPQLEATVWGGLFAPGGTPKPILERLAGAMAKAAADPGYRQIVASLNNDAVSSTPEEFQAFVKREMANYGEVVRRLGIRLE